jgi:hypothetical protein
MAYPTSVFNFGTRNTGDVIQPSDVNNPDTEVAAIETDFISGMRVNLSPLTDVTKSIGTTGARWQNLYTTALFALDIASRVNYLEIDASATGVAVTVKSTGTDSTVNLQVGTKGGTQLKLVDVASLVNFFQFTGKATGVSPDFAFTGSDATVGGTISTKGGIQFKFVDVASLVNFLQFAGTATGTDPTLSVQGDGNRGLKINTAGTGSLSTNVAFSIGTAPFGSAGALRLPNSTTLGVSWRNFGNTADVGFAVGAASPTDITATLDGAGSAFKGNSDAAYNLGQQGVRWANLYLSGGINNAGSLSFTLGQSAPATGATAGFPYIPNMAGTPAGTPTTIAGFVPIVWDDTNKQFDVYSTGAAAWQKFGTGTPTITVKAGSRNGTDYTTASTTYVDVDATNLAFTVTIPTGQKLMVTAMVPSFNSGANNTTYIRIVDGTTAIAEAAVDSPATTTPSSDCLVGVIAGDGASHTIKLQYAANAGTASISNKALSTTTTVNNGSAEMVFYMGTAS